MDEYDDYEPFCEICGSSMFYEDCWHCGGAGGKDGDELMQEDPLWYDEDDWEDCDICDGKGGWWICLNAKNHPDAAVERPAADPGARAADGAKETL